MALTKQVCAYWEKEPCATDSPVVGDLPEPSRALGIPAPVIGGWMYGLAKEVAASPNVGLAVAAVYAGRTFQRLSLANVEYFLLPASKTKGYPREYEQYWKKICSEWMPDLVHIHGTEYPHGLSCMRAQPSVPYLVSIQGLTSFIAKYYFGNVSAWSIVRHLTLRDLLRRDSDFHRKKQLELNGVFEKECVQRSDVVIGRTTWDQSCTKCIDPNVNYQYCGESLRDGFYSSEKWDIRRKREHRIFISQAHTPLKGLHQVLQALSLLKEEFPALSLRIAGNDIVAANSFRQRLRLTGYGSYIASLIRRFGLEGFVEFTGLLTEEEMLREYKEAHLYLCPSAIENSPNSLAEAQILGVPVVASQVGGIPDMIDHNSTGIMYRFEEFEVLADHIRRVFRDDGLAMQLSKNAIATAEVRHDRATCLNKVLELYQDVYSAST